jgi:quinol monooxygenase YgiN
MSPTQKKKAPAKAKSSAKPVKSPAKLAAKATPSKSKQSQAAPQAEAQASINVLVWLRAKKGKEDALARELRALAGASRNEPGCLAFALHPSCANSGDFFLHEIWSSEADLAAHRQTPHFKRWFGLQSAIMESRRRFLAE